MQKKRKAQEAFVEPKPRLSAFAAAKARAAQSDTEIKPLDELKPSNSIPTSQNDRSDAAALPTLLSSFPLSSAHEAASGDDDGTGIGYSSDDQLWTGSSAQRSYKAAQPQRLSSFRSRKMAVLSESPDRLVLKLKADETATFIGEYDLQVISGIVMLSGAALRAGDRTYRVFAPGTHALLTVIAKGGAAEIAVISTTTSMAGLSKVSPLWGKLWNAQDFKDSVANGSAESKRSFMLLRSSTDDPLKRALTALDVDQGIQSALFRIVNYPRTSSDPVVLVSGPKASGKSTISRWLTNTFLTSTTSRTSNQRLNSAQPKTSFWLDLDPGQPEFGPPGQVSLVQLHAPILGPPFTHPTAPSSSPYHMIRSHTLASITPKEDSDHFLSCAMDLLSHYQRLRLSFPDAPLVINCNGWVLGSAVEVLLALVQGFPITDVVLMQPMDMDVVQAIKSSLRADGRVLLVPQRETRPTQSRTSAEFRAMMNMSYFHTSPPSTPSETSPIAKWDTRPISHIRPWQVPYSGPGQGILAILSYGEVVPPAFLSTVLDGMVVAICVIEDDVAIPGYHSLVTSTAQQVEGDEEAEHHDAQEPNIQSLVSRTPDDLPYLLPDRSGLIAPLDPRNSRCVGLALIRGIDREKQELHLLTPLSADEIDRFTYPPEEDDEDEDELDEDGSAQERKRKQIVLVRGKFDSPDWAFMEDVYAGTVFGHGEDDDRGKVEKEKERPYVAERKLDAERGLGSNVWRVRHLPRKLGGGGGGGD
ncbi:hypothetical protein AAFC00_006621 [Neodothiora populina]|uniref:Polynucleotide 5'-hydroxyl-kinase GRC3 n=1 Tax=Neodothiora populina TaxID=2781224 RepID=A0ABR3PBV5_9PEZI